MKRKSILFLYSILANKGYDVPKELWTSPRDLNDPQKAIDLIVRSDEKEYKFMHQLNEIMRPGILDDARQAFEEVFRAEIEQVLPDCTSTIEAFQLV